MINNMFNFSRLQIRNKWKQIIVYSCIYDLFCQSPNADENKHSPLWLADGSLFFFFVVHVFIVYGKCIFKCYEYGWLLNAWHTGIYCLASRARNCRLHFFRFSCHSMQMTIVNESYVVCIIITKPSIFKVQSSRIDILMNIVPCIDLYSGHSTMNMEFGFHWTMTFLDKSSSSPTQYSMHCVEHSRAICMLRLYVPSLNAINVKPLFYPPPHLINFNWVLVFHNAMQSFQPALRTVESWINRSSHNF